MYRAGGTGLEGTKSAGSISTQGTGGVTGPDICMSDFSINRLFVSLTMVYSCEMSSLTL